MKYFQCMCQQKTITWTQIRIRGLFLDQLYTPGVTASIDADESELSCHSHSRWNRARSWFRQWIRIRPFFLYKKLTLYRIRQIKFLFQDADLHVLSRSENCPSGEILQNNLNQCCGTGSVSFQTSGSVPLKRIQIRPYKKPVKNHRKITYYKN